jgi:hypothetical protein
VAYWSFDNEGDLGHDDSENGNNGTVNGAVSADGICGKALNFDGINDFVLIQDSDSLDVTTTGTIIGWVKIPSSFPFPGQGVGFVNKMIHSTGLFAYEFTIGHDGPLFGGIGDGSDAKHVYCSDELRYNNPNFLFDDTWHQLALTWDLQELKIYIDGQFENATNHTVNGAQVTNWDVTIGRRAYASSTNWKYFQGDIDEVRIYDRTLSACEIADLAAECEPIDALIDIDPDTLNKKSHGRWVTVYIALPDGYDVGAIDTTTVEITSLVGNSCVPEYSQQADLGFVPQVGDRDEDGIADLTIKFDRQVLLPNLCLDDVAVTIEGDLTTGEHFGGSDTIRIIDRGK